MCVYNHLNGANPALALSLDHDLPHCEWSHKDLSALPHACMRRRASPRTRQTTTWRPSLCVHLDPRCSRWVTRHSTCPWLPWKGQRVSPLPHAALNVQKGTVTLTPQGSAAAQRQDQLCKSLHEPIVPQLLLERYARAGSFAACKLE